MAYNVSGVPEASGLAEILGTTNYQTSYSYGDYNTQPTTDYYRASYEVTDIYKPSVVSPI